MRLQCVECSRDDASYVCHHCSRPLCDEHAELIVDWVFNESQPANSPEWLSPFWRTITRNRDEEIRAAHCESCHRLNHSGGRWFYQLWNHIQER